MIKPLTEELTTKQLIGKYHYLCHKFRKIETSDVTTAMDRHVAGTARLSLISRFPFHFEEGKDSERLDLLVEYETFLGTSPWHKREIEWTRDQVDRFLDRFGSIIARNKAMPPFPKDMEAYEHFDYLCPNCGWEVGAYASPLLLMKCEGCGYEWLVPFSLGWTTGDLPEAHVIHPIAAAEVAK